MRRPRRWLPLSPTEDKCHDAKHPHRRADANCQYRNRINQSTQPCCNQQPLLFAQGFFLFNCAACFTDQLLLEFSHESGARCSWRQCRFDAPGHIKQFADQLLLPPGICRQQRAADVAPAVQCLGVPIDEFYDFFLFHAYTFNPTDRRSAPSCRGRVERPPKLTTGR